MDISKELLIVIAFGVGLYIERSYAPLRVASNSKTWAQRAQEMALYGTVALLVSYFISKIFYEFCFKGSGWLKDVLELFKEYFPFQNSGTIAFISILIFSSIFLIGLRYRSTDSIILLYHQYGNAFEKMLFDSAINHNLVMLTYKNGWVYIVLIQQTPEVGKNELYLSALVMLSGHKNESAMITLTESKYTELERLMESGQLTTTVLTTSELMSVSPFDFSYNNESKSDVEPHIAS